MKEGGGGDDLGVTWKLPGQTDPPANGSAPIGAAYLAGFGSPVGAAITVTQQPQNAVARVGQTARSP